MKNLLRNSLILSSAIFLFSACTSIDDYAVTKSVAPVVTNGKWRVTLFMDNNNDQTNDYTGYIFNFNASGEIVASKNGTDITGSWNEDNTAKNVSLYFNSADPVLNKLNDNWDVKQISSTQVNLENEGKPFSGKLNISNQ